MRHIEYILMYTIRLCARRFISDVKLLYCNPSTQYSIGYPDTRVLVACYVFVPIPSSLTNSQRDFGSFPAGVVAVDGAASDQTWPNSGPIQAARLRFAGPFRTAALVMLNQFTVTTTRFLNRFANQCDDRLSGCPRTCQIWRRCWQSWRRSCRPSRARGCGNGSGYIYDS